MIYCLPHSSLDRSKFLIHFVEHCANTSGPLLSVKQEPLNKVTSFLIRTISTRCSDYRCAYLQIGALACMKWAAISAAERKIPSNCDLSCGSWSLGVSESLFIQVKTLLKNWPEDLETMLARDISRHHKTIPFLVFDILICQSHIIMLLKNKNIVLRVDCFLQSNCLNNKTK